jgi:hypothetical protein
LSGREDDWEDEDDDEDDGYEAWGMGGRRPTDEQTSLHKIKDVQGVQGSWTVTDCDADKKGEKWVCFLQWLCSKLTSQNDLLVDHTIRAYAVHL